MWVHPSLASNGRPLISHVLVVTLNLDVVIQTLNKPLVIVIRGLAPLKLGVLTVIMLDVINKQTLGLPQILHKLFTENVLSVGVCLEQQPMLSATLEDPDPFVPKGLYTVISIIFQTHQNGNVKQIHANLRALKC